MAVGVRNHSARVYLCPTDRHTAVLCSRSLSVKAVGYGCRYLRKCTLAGLQKQHRGFRIHPNMLSNLPMPSNSQTGSRFILVQVQFAGVTRDHTDLTETQRKAFRVQVWLHQYCVNSLLPGQKDSRIAGEIRGFAITMFASPPQTCCSWHCDTAIYSMWQLYYTVERFITISENTLLWHKWQKWCLYVILHLLGSY